MIAIVYPASLPLPSVAAVTSTERRLLSPADPISVRTIQRDRLAIQDYSLILSPSEADTFRAWWKTTLTYGGAYGDRMAGQMADFRLTIGVGRYTSNFTPPTAQFPDH